VEGERLNIHFDHSGDKKVIASFVVPADQAG
jgi:DNA helicase II / ATP-dependent DNA helicase PcrA